MGDNDNVRRQPHHKKQIEKALKEAETAGLHVTDAKGKGHSTHIIDGDKPHPFRVWSTPKNPDNHAKQIRRHIARNTRTQTEEQNRGDETEESP